MIRDRGSSLVLFSDLLDQIKMIAGQECVLSSCATTPNESLPFKTTNRFRHFRQSDFPFEYIQPKFQYT